MENKFCYLKGLVDCDSGRIQDCNNQRTKVCPLEAQRKKEDKEEKKRNPQAFCYLKGLVSCSPGRVQDCNIKRVKECPKEQRISVR